MRRSTLRAGSLLLLVFAAGVTGGIAMERYGVVPGDDSRSEKRDDRKRQRTVIERFSEDLGLTDGQEARIDTILEHYRSRLHEVWRDVRPRYRTLVDSVRGRIEEVLTEEQTRQYRRLLEERRERDDGRKDRKRRKDSGDGDGRPDDGGGDPGPGGP